MGVARAFVSMPKHALGKWHSVRVVKDNFFHIFYYIGIFNSPNKVYQGKRQNCSKIDYAFNEIAPVSSWSSEPAHYDRLSRIALASVLSREHTTAEYVESNKKINIIRLVGNAHYRHFVYAYVSRRTQPNTPRCSMSSGL